MKDTAAIRWNDRDREIFELLAQHRWIDSRMLSTLTGRDFSSCKRRLQRLAKDGALVRQEVYADGLYRGFSYAAAPKGRTVAEARAWTNDLYVPSERKKSPLHILHESSISRFAARLVELAADAGFDKPFIERRQRELRYAWNRGGSINPDALIIASRGDPQACFFVEVERGRQGDYENGESNRQRKARHYLAYRDGKHYANHLKQFDARGIRTLWVMERESQRDGFLHWLSLTHPDKLFLIASEAEARADPYGAIWRTPYDFNPTDPRSSPRSALSELFPR
jgi:hypothetical protein